MTGNVVAIHLASEPGGPMRPVEQVEAVPGRGLAGEHHADEANERRYRRRQVTLIEEEAVEAANQEHGLALTTADTRRNIVTRGVSLNDLVDATFTVGPVTLQGVKLCEPCRYLADLIGEPRALPALVHRGGLRAAIVSGGPISVGDPVAPASES